jgi:glyoxylase-like metal-dependent hydrolase (beta-lactamase superfamily II)
MKRRETNLPLAALPLREDLLQVRAPAINFYVLKDSTGLYVLDTGFIGGRFLLQRALRHWGEEYSRIRGIIITHGHLDHILNVSRIVKDTGAWVAAPRLDAAHYAGRPKYPGLARTTGILESIGRPVLGFHAFEPDRLLDHDDVIDVWHGLRAVHLPGHTPGHTGYYCERLRWMFTGDLYASYHRGRMPPDIFNSGPGEIPASIGKALSYDLVGVVPNHGDRSSPEAHLHKLKALRDGLRARQPAIAGI